MALRTAGRLVLAGGLVAFVLAAVGALGAPLPLAGDVTEQAGIGFQHTDYHGKRVAFFETVQGGACWGDYDQDGWPDLYLVNGIGKVHQDTSRLYRSQGLGPNGTVTFSDVTRAQGVGVEGVGQGCSWGDYDQDGWPDLYVTSAVTDFSAQRNVLYRNLGHGQGFADVTEATGVDGRAEDPEGQARCKAQAEGPQGEGINRCWSVSSAWLDHDLDGDLDLYVANYAEFPYGACVEPHDVDPKFCLGQLNRLYRNDGGAGFTEVAVGAGVAANSQPSQGRTIGAIAADVNDDGLPDLYTTNDRDANALYLNQGDGTFRDRASELGATGRVETVSGNLTEGSGMGVDVGDLDGDGRADLLSTHLSNELDAVLLGREDGYEQVARRVGYNASVVRISRWGGAFVDLDADGDQDLLVAASGVTSPVSGPLHLFVNEEQGYRYAEPPAWPYSASRQAAHRSLALADVDNDGDEDLLVSAIRSVSDLSRRPHLLVNNARTPGDGGSGSSTPNALTVELVGTDAPNPPVGARVDVALDDRTLTRWVTSGGYASSSDPRVHVGLGNATRGEVTVSWPGGEATSTSGFTVGRDGQARLRLEQPNEHPPGPVASVEASWTEAGDLHVDWPASYAADVDAYRVRLTARAGDETVREIEAGRTEATFGNLTAGEAHVQVRVLDEAGHASEPVEATVAGTPDRSIPSWGPVTVLGGLGVAARRRSPEP